MSLEYYGGDYWFAGWGFYIIPNIQLYQVYKIFAIFYASSYIENAPLHVMGVYIKKSPPLFQGQFLGALLKSIDVTSFSNISYCINCE